KRKTYYDRFNHYCEIIIEYFEQTMPEDYSRDIKQFIDELRRKIDHYKLTAFEDLEGMNQNELADRVTFLVAQKCEKDLHHFRNEFNHAITRLQEQISINRERLHLIEVKLNKETENN